MRFGNDWRNVLRNAWTIRLSMANFVLSAAGIVFYALGIFSSDPVLFVVFQVIGAAFSLSTVVARVTKQQALP